MSPLLYALCARLFPLLQQVGVGTNLALLQIFFALVSRRFLNSRGALMPALADTGLSKEAVRRSVQALSYGSWNIGSLLAVWQKIVCTEARWRPRRQGGFRPVALDRVGFFRPRLPGAVGKHSTSVAGKALPAFVFGMVASVGSVGKKRLPVLRLLLRQKATEAEPALQARLIAETARTLAQDEILLVDAGFGIPELLQHPEAAFVARLDQNVTARRNCAPQAPYHSASEARLSVAAALGEREGPFRSSKRVYFCGGFAGSTTSKPMVAVPQVVGAGGMPARLPPSASMNSFSIGESV